MSSTTNPTNALSHVLDLHNTDRPDRFSVSRHDDEPEREMFLNIMTAAIDALILHERTKQSECKPSNLVALESTVNALTEENKALQETIKRLEDKMWRQNNQLQMSEKCLSQQYRQQRQNEYVLQAKYLRDLQMHQQDVTRLKQQIQSLGGTSVSPAEVLPLDSGSDMANDKK